LIAYGVGELSGLLNGLALGTSFVHLLFQFKFFIFGLILLYGVIYWSNVFTRSDALRTFADFMRVGFWFLWVVLVYTLFTSSYKEEVLFIPTTLRVEMINEGLKVVTPDGEVKFAKATPDQKFKFTVPTVFGLLDVMDSPVYLLTYYLTNSADPIKWGGYAGNEMLPSKIWSRCFVKGITQAPDFMSAKSTICHYLPTSDSLAGAFNTNYAVGIKIGPIALGFFKGYCKDVHGEVSDEVVNTYLTCVDDTVNSIKNNLEEMKVQLSDLKNSGKITEETKNVFIEMTGHSIETLLLPLNVIVTALADRGGEIYSVEVKYPDKTIITPDLTPKKFEINLDYCRKILGLSLTDEEIIALLKRARYNNLFYI